MRVHRQALLQNFGFGLLKSCLTFGYLTCSVRSKKNSTLHPTVPVSLIFSYTKVIHFRLEFMPNMLNCEINFCLLRAKNFFYHKNFLLATKLVSVWDQMLQTRILYYCESNFRSGKNLRYKLATFSEEKIG